MRFKKNPTRLPYSDELLAQQSLTLHSPNEALSSAVKVNDLSKQIKKSSKTSSAIVNIKLQKRLKLQKYRDKLMTNPRKERQSGLDEDDERLIDFLRRYNEYKEKQHSQHCSSPPSDQEQQQTTSINKKSSRKPKLTKLQRAMKDLECTMVQGNALPTAIKPKHAAAVKREILKTKKINLLRNYREQTRHVNDVLEKSVCENGVNMDVDSNNSLDDFKMKLINAVIEKDDAEESCEEKCAKDLAEEDTPISVLIKSNEAQMFKSSGETEKEIFQSEGEREEDIVDEKVRRKIEKQLHIDVTDKYNFLKQTARTKLRPKSTSDFDVNKRFRKNRYRIARSLKIAKKNLLSENNVGQNHFLGFDKSIKRFKDECREGEVNSRQLVNKSYFNWDEFTVAAKVRKIETPQGEITSLGFRDELEFLSYSLVNKKAQSTLNFRLSQRLELWMKICKTRKDLTRKAFEENFHLIEKNSLVELNCDSVSELLDCDEKNIMFAVPTQSPYLHMDKECIESWRIRQNKPLPKPSSCSEEKSTKLQMRHLIKQMILQKQLRCNSTYAAYDMSEQNVTNLYEDVVDTSGVAKTEKEETFTEDATMSYKTSRISYCTSGKYISVNLQSPMKRRMSELLDSESTSVASSYEYLPQAHIDKIEEIDTDETSSSNDVGNEMAEMNGCDEIDVFGRSSKSNDFNEDIDSKRRDVQNEASNGETFDSKKTEMTEASNDAWKNVGDDSSETSTSTDIKVDNVRTDYDKDLEPFGNKAEHNGLISSFLDYGNGQNTKRKKSRAKQSVKRSKVRKNPALVNGGRAPKCKLHRKQLGSSADKYPVCRKFSERRRRGEGAGQVLPRKAMPMSLDTSGESNSSSYESMYDIVKTKTRQSLSKSIFNFEHCKFPRKDGDVFYTTLSLNASQVPVLALMKTKRTLPEYLSRYTLASGRLTPHPNSPKLSMKINKFTKLQIFVIYLKNVYFLFFKN